MIYHAIDENGSFVAGGWNAPLHELESKLMSHLADKQLLTGKILAGQRPDNLMTIAEYRLTIDDDVLSLIPIQ